jgi:hypothetical protein
LVKKLSPYFSHRLPGTIWRILAGERWLVAETREGNARKVNFAAVYLLSGSLQWNNLALPEPWWVTGTAIVEDTLLLQIFADPQKPETKGIIGVHLPTGLVGWQQPEHSFVQLSTEGIIAVQSGNEDPVFHVLSAASGEIISVLEHTQLNTLSYLTQPYLVHPVHYTQENTYFGSIVTFLKQKLGIEPQKAVDYAEFHQLIGISYYIYERKKLSNFLLVLDKEGNVLLHEKLAAQLPGIGLDTFFIIHQYLIVVKDKKELIAYAL